MSAVSLYIPRAYTTCDALRVTYLSLAMSHFMELTTAMFESEDQMAAEFSDKHFTLSVGPICCCCLCLPSPAVTKTRLRWVQRALWLLPYTQLVCFVVRIVWTIASTDHYGRVGRHFTMVWVAALSFLTIMLGVYGMNIAVALCRTALEHYGYQRKSFSLKVLVLVTQGQSIIMDILSAASVFPCHSPHISSKVVRQILENSLYLVVMLVIGVYTWRTYTNLQLQTRAKEDGGSDPLPVVDKESDTTTTEIGS
ncbi:organic solute transporter subunit alpha-like [Portunus trituberculatus]|uniref:organic solute transporter subunit alpha-like n=1 Tax=Portunus trituberculatus TaxID=210409 RepID=UPI001E1CDB5C|nr:organic solute transporter subunit alpha-like [Portunus trituberculatus]